MNPWTSTVGFWKRLLKRDAPHIKWKPGQKIYINGAPYIITSLSRDMQGHVDIQAMLARVHQIVYRIDPSILKEDLR